MLALDEHFMDKARKHLNRFFTLYADMVSLECINHVL